jgi:lipopolysaccharide transport system ATP-binding protein
VLFVSHNMSAVEALCRRAVLLEHGRVIDMGEPRQMVHRYLETVSSLESIPLQQRRDRGGDGSARIAAVEIKNAEGGEVIRAGSRLHITLCYESDKPIRLPRFEIRVTDVNNAGLFVFDSDLTGDLPEDLPASGQVSCVTDPIHLTPGRCYLHAQMRRGRTAADSLEYAGGFDVESSGFYPSGGMPPRSEALCLLRHQWLAGEGSGR